MAQIPSRKVNTDLTEELAQLGFNGTANDLYGIASSRLDESSFAGNALHTIGAIGANSKSLSSKLADETIEVENTDTVDTVAENDADNDPIDGKYMTRSIIEALDGLDLESMSLEQLEDLLSVLAEKELLMDDVELYMLTEKKVKTISGFINRKTGAAKKKAQLKYKKYKKTSGGKKAARKAAKRARSAMGRMLRKKRMKKRKQKGLESVEESFMNALSFDDVFVTERQQVNENMDRIENILNNLVERFENEDGVIQVLVDVWDVLDATPMATMEEFETAVRPTLKVISLCLKELDIEETDLGNLD